MMTQEQAKEYFPTRISVGTAFPSKLKYLVMAPPKWGKTTFFAGVPNALLLAFEEGHMFAECYKIVITGWDAPIRERGAGTDDETGIKYATALEVLDALEIYNPYDFIIVDTVDVAVKLCTDYSCKQAGVKHPSDIEFTGWDQLQVTPFRRFFNRIVKLGVGVACITHVKEEWKTRRGVEEYRRETSLTPGIQRFVHAQADVIINGITGRYRKGQKDRDRVVSFDGSNEIMAGTRIRGVYIPNKYIVDPPSEGHPDAPWVQWESFFKQNPQAGQDAEKFYLKTLPGKDNELEEVEEQPKGKTEEVKEKQSVLENEEQPKKHKVRVR